jgi:hypothetical protein
MDKKEINITIPEGHEIDKENSTFERIVFKPKNKRWRDDHTKFIDGFYISSIKSSIKEFNGFNHSYNYNLFSTEKQAKSSLAMARISQIMANDKRFGGIVNEKKWADSTIPKYVIVRFGKEVRPETWCTYYQFLSFHTKEQRDLFLEENMDLIKDYLMIE